MDARLSTSPCDEECKKLLHDLAAITRLMLEYVFYAWCLLLIGGLVSELVCWLKGRLEQRTRMKEEEKIKSEMYVSLSV